jgi:hypothetical protein
MSWSLDHGKKRRDALDAVNPEGLGDKAGCYRVIHEGMSGTAILLITIDSLVRYMG